MKEEIKINEFIRTKQGIIGIVVKIDEANKGVRYFNEDLSETYYNLKIYNNENFRVRKSNILNHSFNKIDLIEKGDYINKHLVIDKRSDIDDYGKDFLEICIENDNLIYHYIKEEDIQSIVTKEEFKRREFIFKRGV